jgi:GTP-binding protein
MQEFIINTAEFMTSASSRQGWPPPGPWEVAFAGRSNVGKSSLINRLVNRKKLVRTSSRPGCTQQINFFSFNHDSFRFVDLPGYGFAKAPLALKTRRVLTKECYYIFSHSVNVKTCK